jgi:two-component system, OmpR family, phosphate regulon response regulator PhoB
MGKRRALIIDDEPDVRTFLGTVLRDHGWETSSAGSGDEGLELARREPPDVVLLDVMMPERGGLSTLVALRKDERLKSIPVVLVTGIQEGLTHDFGAFLERFKRYHPEAYLEKPVAPERLIEVLEQVTGKRPTSS